MGTHLKADIWAVGGNRKFDADFGPIIAGVTVMPVLGPARAKAAAIISGVEEVSLAVTADYFIDLVGRAKAEIETDIARLAASTKAARSAIKEASAAAQRADVSFVEGIVAEIEDDVRRPVAFETQHHVEDLRDAVDDHGADLDFDAAPLHGALDAHRQAQADRHERLAVLRGLADEARRLVDVARSPEVIRKVREEGREVAARAVVASLVVEMRAARQQAADAVQRLDTALASLGALS